MYEFGLGVILAVLFVAAYLLISTYLGRGKNELGGLHPAVTLNPVDTTHSIGSGQARQALSSGDPGAHRPGEARDVDSGDRGSKN